MDIGQLNIAIEDRFIIVDLNVDGATLPYGDTLYNFAYIVNSFKKDYKIIYDFRNVKNVTHDLIEFIEEFENSNGMVLINQDDSDFFKKYVNENIPVYPVKEFKTEFKYSNTDLTIFADGNSIDADYSFYKKTFDKLTEKFKGIPNKFEYELFSEKEGLDIDLRPYYKSYQEYLRFCKSSNDGIALGTEIIIGRRYLSNYFEEIGKRSLLSQFCLMPKSDSEMSIRSFHSHAINDIDANNNLVKFKPYISSKRDLLHQDLTEFQRCINDPNVKEKNIQDFLERNPYLLHALGYKNIYPKVVLERDDGSFLQPDFMLEPIGDEWWDILDIKLPNKKIIVDSNKDRYRFSSSITELQAQLREYSSYFENEKYSKRIEKKYGIKCYKPKLIGIIGEQISANDDRQIRRLMTSYSDLDIIPFPKLYEICKERILI